MATNAQIRSYAKKHGVSKQAAKLHFKPEQVEIVETIDASEWLLKHCDMKDGDKNLKGPGTLRPDLGRQMRKHGVKSISMYMFSYEAKITRFGVDRKSGKKLWLMTFFGEWGDKDSGFCASAFVDGPDILDGYGQVEIQLVDIGNAQTRSPAGDRWVPLNAYIKAGRKGTTTNLFDGNIGGFGTFVSFHGPMVAV